MAKRSPKQIIFDAVSGGWETCNRNVLINKCKHCWVLNLDSDDPRYMILCNMETRARDLA